MIALVRYLIADVARSQRWVAPFVIFLAVFAVFGAAGGRSVGTAGVLAAALFPLAAWLTWVTATCEDPLQEAITATSANGPGRTRFGKYLTGSVLAGLLGAPVVLFTFASTHFDAGATAAAVVAVIANVVGGAAVGFVCAPPVISSRGFTVLTITLVSLAELIVPWCPPSRATMQALNDTHNLPVRLAVTGTATFGAAALLVLGGLTLTRRRS